MPWTCACSTKLTTFIETESAAALYSPTNVRRVLPEVLVPAPIAIGVAHPMPFMSIVVIAGILRLTPTPVCISIAGNAHAMLAL